MIQKNPNLRRKILFITEFYTPERTDFCGGVEARTHHIIKQLSPIYDVKVISRSRHQVEASFFSLLSRIWFQVSAILKGLWLRPDVVEGSNFVCYIPAFVIARLTGAKAVMWSADSYGKLWFRTMSFPVALAGYVLEWVAMKLPFDSYIAMSKATKKKLMDFGILEEKISVVYGGVNVQAIKKIQVKKFDRPSVVTVSRLVGYKRVNDLIRAVGKLQSTIPDLHLYIVGDGPERSRLEELSNNITNKNSVHFLGTISQQKVWKLMKKCHVFSLPSAVEGFGLVTIEAMAAGLPYVNSDIPATREVTHNGLGGYLYPSGDEKLLADLVKKNFESAIKDTNSTKKVFNLVRSYDWKQISKKTDEIYKLL